MILSVLVACLIFEFLLAIFIFKGDVLAPAIVFSFVFLMSALDLMLMSVYWNVNLQPITLWIIVVGVLSFIAGTVISRICPKVRIKAGSAYILKYEENYQVSKGFLNLMIFVYILFIAISMLYVIKSRGVSSAFFNIFSSYVIALGGDTELELPFYLSLPTKFLFLAGYAWSYLLANNWIVNRKVEIRYIILFALTLVMSISNGKRGELVALSVTLVVYTLLVLKKNKSRKLSRRVYFIMLLMLVAVAFLFQPIATMMGRDSDLFEPLEYFSIYLGAPILNLNTSIMRGGFSHPTFLSETFHSLYTAIGENFGVDAFVYTTDRIFWASPNGKRVGNVATTFYDFYHDCGFAGVVVLSFLMGFIIHSLYRKFKYNKQSNKMLSTMVFSYMLWMVARSFFANSFYDWFTLSTIITLLIWWFISVTIPKIGLRKGKTR